MARTQVETAKAGRGSKRSGAQSPREASIDFPSGKSRGIPQKQKKQKRSSRHHRVATPPPKPVRQETADEVEDSPEVEESDSEDVVPMIITEEEPQKPHTKTKRRTKARTIHYNEFNRARMTAATAPRFGGGPGVRTGSLIGKHQTVRRYMRSLHQHYKKTGDMPDFIPDICRFDASPGLNAPLATKEAVQLLAQYSHTRMEFVLRGSSVHCSVLRKAQRSSQRDAKVLLLAEAEAARAT